MTATLTSGPTTGRRGCLEPNVDSSGGKITIAGVNGTIAVSAGMKTDGQGTVCVQNNRGTHCQ